MTLSKNKIAIIGGGAAGMMAAVTLSERMVEFSEQDRPELLIFEKNAYLGAKVLISGGGRCNVTTGIFDVKKLLLNYPRGAKFLMSAMFRFPPDKVMEWFENHGVKLKVEEDLRVFPVSNNGKDVVGALERELHQGMSKIFLNAQIIFVRKNKEGFLLQLKSGEKYEVDFLILASGGNAYRHTGSTGDGYSFAKELGHTITQLGPSLNAFVVGEKWISQLAGVSIKKAELTLNSHLDNQMYSSTQTPVNQSSNTVDTQKKYLRTGPFVFTHRGVSGPAIFALSAQAAYEQCSPDKQLQLSINFFPDEQPDVLYKRLHNLIQHHAKKHLINFLDFLLPKSLCGVFVELLKIDPQLIVANVNKEQRKLLIELLQNFQLTIIGRSAGEEFVTAGGVSLEEVNTNTMESKICPGLYFCGEILDIDGFTGGFNLQAAWATGRLAAQNLLTKISCFY